MNNRRMAIIRLMDSRKKFTARELAERFQVSVRTIQRDLDVLQQAGLPLYAEVGANGGYRALPNRILPPLQLTQQEALGLFMMLEHLAKIPDFPYGSIRTYLAEEYFAGLPHDVQDAIERMRNHLAIFQVRSAPMAQPAMITTSVLNAATDKREIEFQYDAKSGVKRVLAFPLGVYYEQGYWYMPAMRQGRVWLYRTDRMTELQVLDRTDESIPSLHDWLKNQEDAESEEVMLSFTEFGARLAGSDPLFKTLSGNQWTGKVPRSELPFTARRILGYGPEVKVVKPKHLQDLVLEMLERNIEQYR